MTKNFPSPSDRAEILARRERILAQLGATLAQAATGLDKVVQSALADFSLKYPPADVAAVTKHVLSRIQRNQADMGVTHAQQESNRYRHYVEIYRRFGGSRPFMTKCQFMEHVERLAVFSDRLRRQEPMVQNDYAEAERIHDLLLSCVELWEDITLEAPPKDLANIPRPSEID